MLYRSIDSNDRILLHDSLGIILSPVRLVTDLGRVGLRERNGCTSHQRANASNPIETEPCNMSSVDLLVQGSHGLLKVTRVLDYTPIA